MTPPATFYTIATIFIATNAILCQEAGVNDANKRDLVSISSNGNSKVDPLPSKIFKRPLTDFLSPEIFSQPNPLVYFLTKATELHGFQLHQTDSHIKYYLITNEFPGPYIPYAKVLSSLLPCLVFLQYVKSAIIEIQDAEEFDYPALPSDIPPPDNRFLALFSEEIFEDDNPPSVVLLVLLHILEDEGDEAITWLKNLLKSKGDFSQTYRKYINKILQFLDGFAKFEFRRLKQRIVELQRDISETLNSSNFDQPKA